MGQAGGASFAALWVALILAIAFLGVVLMLGLCRSCAAIVFRAPLVGYRGNLDWPVFCLPVAGRAEHPTEVSSELSLKYIPVCHQAVCNKKQLTDIDLGELLHGQGANEWRFHVLDEQVTGGNGIFGEVMGEPSATEPRRAPRLIQEFQDAVYLLDYRWPLPVIPKRQLHAWFIGKLDIVPDWAVRSRCALTRHVHSLHQQERPISEETSSQQRYLQQRDYRPSKAEGHQEPCVFRQASGVFRQQAIKMKIHVAELITLWLGLSLFSAWVVDDNRLLAGLTCLLLSPPWFLALACSGGFCGWRGVLRLLSGGA